MATYKQTIKKAVLLPFLLFGLFSLGQSEIPSSSIHKIIQSRTNEIYDSLVAIRRDFHKHPELSEQEINTSKKIEKYLLDLGLEVRTGIGGYGVVGILKGGREGKKIAWRADIDAIATTMPDVVDFSSENKGVRHICGHDVHTTIGLGIANVLASQREKLEGTIYFIFQPSEEIAKGAKMMMDDGLFDMIQPEEIYALHMSPYPVGTIATRAANVFSHITVIELEYKVSQNQEALLTTTKEIISNTQTHQPNTPFWDFSNVFHPKMGVTNPNTLYTNFIALISDFNTKETNDRLTIRVALTASDRNQLDVFLASIQQKIKNSEHANALISASFNFQKDMPVMFTPMNDASLTSQSMETIATIYGPQSIIPLHGVGPFQFSDDFAFFQESVPGVYFFLGGSNYEKQLVAMPHTPTFAVDEECIKTGVSYFSSMLVERLDN